MSIERPILFNDQMVQAILDGRKTQTRRPFKVQPDAVETHHWRAGPFVGAPYRMFRYYGDHKTWSRCASGWDEVTAVHAGPFASPFGVAGDRLWVRECFRHEGPAEPAHVGRCRYRASDKPFWSGMGWTPSIHMPRWASRITLDVVSVWAEQVQEISQDDAEAEGFDADERAFDEPLNDSLWATGKFQDLWNSIYGNWDANPWVWACEFVVKEVKA